MSLSRMTNVDFVQSIKNYHGVSAGFLEGSGVEESSSETTDSTKH